jgi:protein SCO1/2
MMAATGGGVLYFFDRERTRRLDSVKQGPSAGKAAIGGPFALRLANENGRVWNTKELHGRYGLLYFGFTMCPDICPDELEKMAEAVDLVNQKMGQTETGGGDGHGKEKEYITPVFVSIDPERDTVARVKEYVREFHPKLLGLTGSVAECKNAAKQYRVYYHKTGEADDADYLVDHSIIMYLVDKKGEFVTFYGKNYEAEEMADAIVQHMKRLG